MKKLRFARCFFVSFPEWAQIRRLCACLVVLAAYHLGTWAAADDEVVARLYRQYMGMPTKQLYQTGHAYLNEGKLDEAMVCFTIVGNRTTDGMDAEERRYCAYALNNAGGIAQLRSSYSTAFSYFKKAMQVADEPLYQCYNNIAGIYLYYNDFTNARSYLDQAFTVSREQADWNALANALSNLMFLNWRVDSTTLSAEIVSRYASTPELPHDSLYRQVMAIGNGMRALSTNDYAAAVDIFNHLVDSIAIANEQRNDHAPIYLASAYMHLGDYDNALKCLGDLEDDTRQNGDNYLLMLIHRMQIDCYAAIGREQDVREMKSRLNDLRDSINTADELSKIKNIEFFHEVDRYEKQVVKLSEEKNARSLAAAVSLVALAVVLAVLFYVVRQRRQLKQSNKDLYRMNEELRQQAEQARRQRHLGDTEATGEAEDTEGGSRELTAAHQTLMELIYNKLDDVDFIAQQDLTVERLAEAVGVHEKTVSAVINEATGKNFNTLLNEYRIREVCKRLTDVEHYGQMTNETIAEGLGYKSRSHFIRTFKKVTGLTPSQYQKIAYQEQQ